MFWRRKKASIGEGRTPSTLEDIQIARAALARGENRHAVRHLAQALEWEPQNRDGRALLDRIIGMTSDPLTLVPWEHPTTSYLIVAVRAYIYARRGEPGEALSLIAEIYQSIPTLPFLPWVEEWLPGAVREDTLTPESAVALVRGLIVKLAGGADVTEREAIGRLLPALERYTVAHPHDAAIQWGMSTLMRWLGRLDEALTLARAAHALQPEFRTAVTLGEAYRARGALAAAIDAFREASRHNPDDLAIRLDLGDKLCDIGQTEAGLQAYQEVLDREPQHPWALSSFLYYRSLLDPEGPWGWELDRYAESHPDNERAQLLTGESQPYLRSLPEPSDALINGLRQLDEQGTSVRQIKASLSSLEAPSARLAIEHYQRESYGRADLQLDVLKLQRPDPRLPRGPVDYILWRYQGNDPQPAVDPPTPGVAAAVAALAARPYEAGAWSYQAREIAAELGPRHVDNLLGVMVHPPARRASHKVWAWIQRVQVASAFILAHIDSGWESSLRRRALFSLARGPLDWTVGAAIIALAQVAIEEPVAKTEIEALYLDLLAALPRPGGIPYAYALAVCSIYLPASSAELRQQAGRLLDELQGEHNLDNHV